MLARGKTDISHDEAEESAANNGHQKQKEQSNNSAAAGSTSSAVFAETMGGIHNEMMSGEARMSSLQKPPADAFDRLVQTFFSQSHTAVQQGLQAPTNASDDSGRIPLLGRALEFQEHSDYTMISAQALEDDIEFDDGLSIISAENYILFRLGPQIKEYSELAPWLEWGYWTYQVTIFLGTMFTGMLGLLGLRTWVPLVIAFLATVETVAQFEMVSPRLAAVNAALVHLKGLKIWWQSLSKMEKRNARNKVYLVEATEDAIGAVHAVWGQGNIPTRKKDGNGDQDSEGKDKEKQSARSG